MNTALARYLKDFGEPAAPQPAHEALPDFGSAFEAPLDDFPFAEEPGAIGPDLEAVRQEAYAEGYETASVELSARQAPELEEIRAHHAPEHASQAQKFK